MSGQDLQDLGNHNLPQIVTSENNWRRHFVASLSLLRWSKSGVSDVQYHKTVVYFLCLIKIGTKFLVWTKDEEVRVKDGVQQDDVKRFFSAAAKCCLNF